MFIPSNFDEGMVKKRPSLIFTHVPQQIPQAMPPYMQQQIPAQKNQRGVTLIELILFMLIIGIALVAITRIMNLTSVTSTDPVRTKQALSIAESMMDEILLQAFTWCDPDDPNAATATSTASCSSAAAIQGLGPNNNTGTPETRENEPRFDNVGDYHGYTTTHILNIQGANVDGTKLDQYAVRVSITPVSGSEQLRIDVEVNSGDTRVLLTGIRYRYAPQATP